ncbi:MAG TPA: glycosyltransferase [Thermoplasmata archaeon]|nr:glycosyltransferase [Thermoplasmata archaeon]
MAALADPASGRPARVTVVVTVLKDPRVAETIASLLQQTRLPEEILIDDGGVTDVVRTIAEKFHAEDPRVRYLYAPGNIPESRNTAIATATGDLLAFLDADEVAPPGWLAALLAPFDDPSVGFTGGPTPGRPGTVRTIGARYYDGYLRRFYDTVARHRPHALPMGNSAFRKAAFDRVGPLDTTLYRKAASEDQEIADRILHAGFRGQYVPEAWVHHDFSELSVPALLRKQRIYAEGGYVVWRRRGTTYEASGGRVAPYVALPLVAIVGALLLVAPVARVAGAILVVLGLGGLGLLALVLTIVGLRNDAKYPGLRYSALEIPRRWATLYGAFRGFLTYGWSGRRAPDGRRESKP